MNIIDALYDKRLFRPLFRDLSTWSNWVTVLKAIFGLQMDKKELAFLPIAPAEISLQSALYVSFG